MKMAEKLEKDLAVRKAEKKKEKPAQKPKGEKAAKAGPVDTKGITVKKSDEVGVWSFSIRVLVLIYCSVSSRTSANWCSV